MAALQSVTISTVNNTSVLDLFIDNELLTQYSFDNNSVTLTSIDQVETLSLDDFIDNVEFIRIWLQQIRNILNPPILQEISDFETELKKLSASVSFFYERESTITDSVFNPSTKQITFQPRIETVLTFRDFRNWYNALRIYASICEEF